MQQMVLTAHSSKIVFTFKLLNCQILYNSLTFHQPQSYSMAVIRFAKNAIPLLRWCDWTFCHKIYWTWWNYQ